MNLKDKIVLVTGSTRGIGKAMALSFAKEGCKIIINHRNSDFEAEEFVNELNELGVESFVCKADISSQEDVAKMFNLVNEKYAKIDILVNNAGWTKFIEHKNLKELDEEIFSKVLDINLKGTYHCIREFSSIMPEDSLIINIASTAGINAKGSNIAYCASKAGVINLTKSLARALAPKIRVNCIAPGLVMTKLTESWTEFHEQNRKLRPLEKDTMPEDIANIALAIAKYYGAVTGECITVDGGRYLN